MVDVISRRDCGFPPKFKRRRVSAVRDYPRGCGMLVPDADLTKEGEEFANIKPLTDVAAGCPVFKKYPPPKIRKGVAVIRKFPPMLNAPSSLSNQNPSDLKDSCQSANRMAMAHCKQSEVLNAIDDHACTNEQGDLSRPLYDPIETNASDLPACMDPEQVSFSMVDKDCKPDVEEYNLSEVVCDEQCLVACRDVEESSSPVVAGDEQCQAVLFEVDNDLVVLKDEQSAKQVSSSTVVGGEPRPNGLFKVHDCPATSSGEEIEEALMGTNNSQAVVTNDSVIVDEKELRIAHDKVKEVLHLFQEVYLELSQGSEGKQKVTLLIEAASLMKEQWINKEKRLGPVPGVEVGDCFDYRVELSVIGLHYHYICGIDYIQLDGRVLATSIVDSGRYDNVVERSDEEEFGDVLIYSGQGENPKVYLRKKPVDDQKLERGNLALKNSAEAKTPIRVIRKFPFKCVRRKIVHKFVYDGLYFVDSYREEKSSTGKFVFKFVLKRFPGQAKLHLTKLVRKEVAKEFERKELVCINDISQGKERVPVRAMNSLDDEKPPFFNYITNVTYSEFYRPSMPSGGCNCTDGCSDSEDCPCVAKNGGEIPYNYKECIMSAMKPLIIECGPSCKCFTSCLNRVSQRGIRFPLEVFKTKTKGWGVRSQSSIPSGSFICEYIGEILRDKEVEQKKIGQDEYLFDIGNYCGTSLHDTNALGAEENESFTIDAAKFGNVGRFINHSCSPNLFAQNVLFDHDDQRMPHVMLFAIEDIPPLTELSYDYNYKIGEVYDVNGNIKEKKCYCGSTECSGRMY